MYIDLDIIKKARRVQLKALELGQTERPLELSKDKELQKAINDFDRANNRRKNKVVIL